MRLPRSSTGQLRLAVVGVGIAGQSHLLDAVTAPDVNVIAVCARHLERAISVASDFGVPGAYDDLQQMLKEQGPDAVVVATPPSVLAAQVAACLRAGANVVAEKPLAIHQRELNDLTFALCESGRSLVVAYTRRYRTAWATARDWIATGQIGMPVHIECHWLGPYRERYSRTASTYRADPVQRVAGVILDTGSHVLDAVLYLTGELGKVTHVDLEIDKQERVDIAGSIRLEQLNGTSITLEFRDGAQQEVKSVCIRGTTGTISLDVEGACLYHRDDLSMQVADTYHRRPVDDLLALWRGESVCGASLVEASKTVRCLMRIYKMAAYPLNVSHSWQRPRAKALARLSGAC